MSVFHFPRINIKGLILVNVGTANNDDYSIQNGKDTNTYSGVATLPNGTTLGQSLRVGNSATVQPYAFNGPDGKPMNDAQMVAWMQEATEFAAYKNQPVDQYVKKKMIPGEWNYFGNMGLNMMATSVVGVTVPDGSSPTGTKVYRASDPFNLIGATLSFNNRPDSTGRSTAMIIDVNPESPPASQIFTDNLMLHVGQKVVFNAKPTKASTRWINFQRNTVLSGPNGASGTFQCMIPLAHLQGQPIVNILQKYVPQGKVLGGLVFRYTLFRSLQDISTFRYPDNDQWVKAITDRYKTQGENPTYVQISGTIAPWYEGEMQSMMPGNYLVPDGKFPSPGGNKDSKGNFKLAPATAYYGLDSPVISIDMTAALPDSYAGTPDNCKPLDQSNNPKFNLGALKFGYIARNEFHEIGELNYTDTAAGDAAGWIFDYPRKASMPFDIDTADYPGYSFAVNSPNYGQLLLEQQFLIASDQSACFAEQALVPQSPAWKNMPPLPQQTTTFSSQGYMDTPISFKVFEWSRPITKSVLATFDVWMLDQTYVMPPATAPLPQLIQSNYIPGSPITIPVTKAGVYIITLTTTLKTPREVKEGFSMMTSPMINLRILPNYEFSSLYTFDESSKPKPTAQMSWEALYNEVFRNYYLLYPGMSKIVPLNEPKQWIGPTLFNLLDRVDPKAWNTMSNMPRTRDLSATRRWLVQAYVDKFANQSPAVDTPKPQA